MTVEASNYIPIDAPIPETTKSSQSSRSYLDQFVSMRVVIAALGRRRRFWMTVAVAGLIAGMAITVVVPRKYTATATLVLVHNPNDDPTQDMATDVALLNTAVVAQQVIDHLGLHLVPAKLMSEYNGVAVSSAVLQINVTATEPQDAIARTNALVASFLAVRTSIFHNQNLAVIEGLRDQVSEIQGQEKSLQQQIHATGAKQSGPLVAVFDQDVTQVSQLQQTIAADNQILNQVIQGSQVLASAILVPHSAVKRIAVDGASGLVAGLALGAGLVATQTIVSDRVRRRDEFAAALGAPVALSVGKISRPRWMKVRRLRHRLRRPSRQVRRLARHVCSEMTAAPGRQNLAVVSLDSPEASALVVAESARALTTEGKRVTIVDLTAGGLLGRILGVKGSGTRETYIFRTKFPIFVVIPPDDDQVVQAKPEPTGLASLTSADAWRSTQVVLVLAELDPAVGARRLGDWVAEAVVVVTAGRSSHTRVQANTEMLRSAGVTIISAVLVATDHNDDSFGDALGQPRHRPVDGGLGSVSLSGES